MAACPYEAIAAEVGEHSFTSLLIHELAKAAAHGRSISVSALHECILAGLGDYKPRLLEDSEGRLLMDSDRRPIFEPPRRRTPIHYFVSPKHESIVLAPLRLPAAPEPAKPQEFRSGVEFATGSNTNDFIKICASQFPQVLLSVRLESVGALDPREWLEWLLKAPLGAQDIKVEGWYGSFSTLVLLNVPMGVWHAMPDNPAVSFIGFITTENLATDIQKDQDTPKAHETIRYAESIVADSAIDIDSMSVSLDESLNRSTSERKPDPWSKSRHSAMRSASIREFLEDRSSAVGEEGEDGKELSFRDIHQPQIYSCPYRQRDPCYFNIRNYKVCSSQSFSSLLAVK